MKGATQRRARAPRALLRVLALAVCLGALGGLPSAAAARGAAGFEAPGRIGGMYLALGDSLAAGYSTSQPATRGYVALFHDLLVKESNRPLEVKNLSVPGETVSSLLYGGQLAAAEHVLRDALARGRVVSPITMNIGGNDVRALRAADDAGREAGLANFRRDLALLFDRLVAATTVAGQRQSDILTMTIYNPYGGDPNTKGSDAWWLARFNRALVEVSADRAIVVAPAADAFDNQKRRLTWMPADFHPNNTGHVVLARALWKASGYDRQPPTLELWNGDELRSARRFVTVKFRAADNVGVASVRAQVDGQALPAPLFQRAIDAYVTYWDATTAAKGPHELTLTAADAAGNDVVLRTALQR